MKRSTLAQREGYVRGYRFPAAVAQDVGRAHGELSDDDLRRAEIALREWLVASVYRERREIGVPSRAVDWLWQEFVSLAADHREFCQHAFGSHRDSPSDSSSHIPTDVAMANAVAAWDRSKWSRERDAVMFELDRELELPDAICVDPDSSRALTRQAFAAVLTGRLRHRRFQLAARTPSNDAALWLFPGQYVGSKRRFDLGQLPQEGFFGPGGAN